MSGVRMWLWLFVRGKWRLLRHAQWIADYEGWR